MIELSFCVKKVSMRELIKTIVFIASFLFYIAWPKETMAWWDHDWDYRFSFTLDNSNVGEQLPNFPVHVDLTNDAPENFWTHVKSDGSDIRIIDEDDSTNLSTQAHLEGWDYNNSKGHIWVKRNVAAVGNKEVVYIYYGNSEASGVFNPTTKANTYDSNYVGVWHLDETSDQHLDATSNNNDSLSETLTAMGNAVGKINGADNFNGTTDYLSMGTSGIITSDGTIEAWVKTANDAYQTVVSVGDWDSANYFTLAIGDGATGWLSNELITMLRTYSTPTTYHRRTGYCTTTRTELIDDTFHHIAVSAGTEYKIYLDGESKSLCVYHENDGEFTDVPNADFVGIGRMRLSETRYFSGNIDEVRISNIVRPDEWLEYSYLSDKGDAGSVGGEEFGGYIVESVPAGITPVLANDWSTDTTTAGQTGVQTTGLANETYRIAEFDVNYSSDIDWSNLVADNDGTKSVLHYPSGISSLPGISGDTFTLYIPKGNSYKVAICPDAQSMEDVSLTCDNVYFLGENANNVTLTTLDGIDYWKVTNLTGTGGTGVDPSLSLSIEGVGAGTITNGVSTTIASEYNTLPFGHLSVNTPKYVAHKLTVSSNSNYGYTVSMLLVNYMQGNNPLNDIDPFAATNVTWNTPQVWSSPTGSIPNVNTGWIGGNTSDTRISGWGDGAGKFGPVSTLAYNVMYSSVADSGTSAYVTYVMETNVFQPPDLYSGILIYNLLPTY
jgi:hypothetical protein